MNDLLTTFGHAVGARGDSLAKRSLQAVRTHLGMDVAYISEMVGDQSVFREVDAPGLEHLITVGDSKPLEQVYCLHIVEGRLPELIPDTAAEPLAMSMPITKAVPIGAHVSVPLRRPNGEVYGMFCCLSATPRETLNPRDMNIVHAFADLVADEIGRDLMAAEVAEARARRLNGVLAGEGLSMVLQPICTLRDERPTGYEALARFSPEPVRGPDAWFAEAAQAGLGPELECAAISAALVALDWLPAPLTLSVNASPTTVASGLLARALSHPHADRLVLELTEHASVADYGSLCTQLRALRARGVKLAIDDAGAGFSSLQHILRLQPDIIKLDMSLTRDVDTDLARQALAAAMLLFARRTGAVLVAEGVETDGELAMLRSLGVSRGQGWRLGRPLPMAAVAAEHRAAA